MNRQEACERIEMLMAQPYHHNLQRVKAILEDLEQAAYERGYQAGKETVRTIDTPTGNDYTR